MNNIGFAIMAIGIFVLVSGCILYKIALDRDKSYGEVIGVVFVVIGFIIHFIGCISWCCLALQFIFTS